MKKRLKRLLGDLMVACISLTLLVAWIFAPAEPIKAQVPSGIPYASPSNGAGRVICAEIATYEVETSIDIPETETPEIDVYIALETIPETEEYIEVIPEPDPIIYTDIDALIVQIAGEYGLPWELVRAVCYVESGFDPNAISATGDYGLMQVSYINHGWLGLENPLDPEENLRAGCTILKQAIEKSDGDFTRALMRYNRGDGYAMSQWSQGIYSTAYTDKVLGKYYEYLRGGY